MDLKALRADLDVRLADLRAARADVVRERTERDAARARLATALEAQQVCQRVAQQVQRAAQERVAPAVSRCLAAVFPDAYTFGIEFLRRRGRTEARLRFSRRDLEVDPLTAAGGGCVAVAALAARAATVVAEDPPRRRLLVLDEPLVHVSPEYRPLVPRLLEGLAEELGLQTVLATNEPAYVTGTVVRTAAGVPITSETARDPITTPDSNLQRTRFVGTSRTSAEPE